MTYAFAAIDYSARDANGIPIAIFWDRKAANAFALAENDAVRADIIEVEEIPLVDNYGFPCEIADLLFIAPWLECN